MFWIWEQYSAVQCSTVQYSAVEINRGSGETFYLHHWIRVCVFLCLFVSILKEEAVTYS